MQIGGLILARASREEGNVHMPSPHINPDAMAGYQSPFLLLRSGHISPHEIIAPKRVEMFTICGQIIPAPMYVALKSKKKLKNKEMGVKRVCSPPQIMKSCDET